MIVYGICGHICFVLSGFITEIPGVFVMRQKTSLKRKHRILQKSTWILRGGEGGDKRAFDPDKIPLGQKREAG